ncbi:MAG: glycosyltransferase family 2 protein [Gammaproteobacteria bacterium]
MDSASKTVNSITVSVILATCNRAYYLPQALDSLLNQTHQPEEIIIVDDGSTDNTAEIVGRYDGRCRYFRTENQGKSSAINFAIPRARSSHIWIFDDDDVALPDALQLHVNFLASHPEADFSYSTNYVYYGEGDIWQRDKWRSKSIPNWSSNEFMIRTMENMNTLLQGMLIPKRCFLEVGPFDELLLRAQDHEMLIRLAHRFRGLNIQQPTFVLRDHQGPRSPKIGRHDADQLPAIQLQYQQQFFLKVRDNYPLSCYLACEPALSLPIPILDDTQRGQALLQRGCIMLRQGLFDAALADLENGFDYLNASGHYTEYAGLILSKVLDIDPWIMPHRYHLVLKLSRLLKAAGTKTLAPAMVRGMYWSFRRSLHRHRWREAARSAMMLCLTVLCNTRGFITRYIKRSPTEISAT